MKLEHLPEYITIAVTVTLGMLLAVYLGTSTGAGSNTPFFFVGACLAFVTILFMREKIWILIPLFWPMVGQVRGLPGDIPLRDAVIMYVLLAFLALKALKIINAKPRYGLLDYFVIINVVYIAFLFIKNPVGLSVFNSEYIGARSYIDIACATFAFWILAHITISPRLSAIFPLIVLSGNLLLGFINFITFHIPSTAPILYRFYTGVAGETFNNPDADPETRREQYLYLLGADQIRLLCSYFSPITLFNPLYIFRFLTFVLSVYFIFRSGHRSGIADCIAFILIASYFRSGLIEVIRLGVFIVPLIVFVIAFHGTLYELPIPAQRALSFLPGNWNQRAINDADGSTEWRVDMWKVVWSSDQYIKNWWLGDGFGFSQKELVANSLSRQGNLSVDSFLIVGDYHNGPLSALKFSGYVGTFLFFILMIGAVVAAWKVILRTKGTPFFGFGLFVGSYLIYFPFKFIFIFGSYKSEPPLVIYLVALLGLVDRSAAKWKSEQKTVQEPQSSHGGLIDVRRTLMPSAHRSVQ